MICSIRTISNLLYNSDRMLVVAMKNGYIKSALLANNYDEQLVNYFLF